MEAKKTALEISYLYMSKKMSDNSICKEFLIGKHTVSNIKHGVSVKKNTETTFVRETLKVIKKDYERDCQLGGDKSMFYLRLIQTITFAFFEL